MPALVYNSHEPVKSNDHFGINYSMKRTHVAEKLV